MKKRLLLLIAATAACSDRGDTTDAERAGGAEPARVPDASAPFVTQDSSYLLVYDGDITLTIDIPFDFTNPLPDTVYVVNCGGALAMTLERLEGDAWQPYWSTALPECLDAPIVIPPGTTYQDTARIHGVLPGHDSDPAFGSAEPAGTYRLRWGNLVLHYGDYVAGRGFGDPLPAEVTISNTFRLEDPRD